jgi:uncharacterized membrane protein
MGGRLSGGTGPDGVVRTGASNPGTKVNHDDWLIRGRLMVTGDPLERHVVSVHLTAWVPSGRDQEVAIVDVLVFVAPLIVGFTASAEFASFAFVHPVIGRLEPGNHIRVEQGLLRTFGRVMPALMPLSAVVTVAYAAADDGGGGDALRWVAAGLVLTSVVTTLAVNVPINAATSRWDPEQPPADWRAIRQRWERFQGIRTVPLLIAFILICLAISLDA